MSIELDCLSVEVKKGKLKYNSNVAVTIEPSAEELAEYAAKGWFIRPVDGAYEVYSERLNTDTLSAAVSALSSRLGV